VGRGQRAPAGAREVFLEALGPGVPISVAARVAGVSRRTGVGWARAAGVSRPSGRPVADPARTREVARLIGSGAAPGRAAVAVGLSASSGRYVAARMAAGPGVSPLGLVLSGQAGRVEVDVDAPPGYRLGWVERDRIALARARGEGVRQIAAGIGRSPSTVSRELSRNRAPDGEYRSLPAEQKAQARAQRPKRPKLAREGPLRDRVADGLRDKLSPEQIAARLRLEHPEDPEMRVCHETIYQAIYVQARGGLKREVEQALRRGRAYRRPRREDGQRRGRIPGMVPIGERPPDVEDRAVPGHWEGDLLMGSAASNSAIATLVERGSRVTLPVRLPDGHTADKVCDALIPVIAALPDALRRSLTWDQGKEMSQHLRLAEQADIDVYFADPHSPWQRGTNENTNGLLRQYFPKGTDLSVHTEADLADIAAQLNRRPRKTLGWLTPAEAYALMLGIPVTIGGRPAQLPDTLKPLAQRCVDP